MHDVELKVDYLIGKSFTRDRDPDLGPFCLRLTTSALYCHCSIEERLQLDEAMTATTSQEALNALLCDMMPPQGHWTDEQYLWLTDRTRRMVEFTDGRIEELPMPTIVHQAILSFLHDLFKAYLGPRGGFVLFAGLRVRIREGKFREPDLAALCDRSDARNQERFWLGADLVVEVVSPDDPDRDLVVKRADYAEGPTSPSTGSWIRVWKPSRC